MSKWLGAAMILLACGGYGFSIAGQYRKKVYLLRQLLEVLQSMERELQFKLSTLPEICALAGQEVSGNLGQVFTRLAGELNRRKYPDAGSCMAQAVGSSPELPREVRRLLQKLGATLGRYDLEGQLRGIRAVRREAVEELRSLSREKELRLRSYQTLGLCAGAALVVLFA